MTRYLVSCEIEIEANDVVGAVHKALKNPQALNFFTVENLDKKKSLYTTFVDLTTTSPTVRIKSRR